MSNPNDPAYPLDDGVKPCYGLTIRQEFVKAAMHAFCSRITGCGDPEDVARGAVAYADAALAEEARTRQS